MPSRVLADLGLDKDASISVVYVFSAPARSQCPQLWQLAKMSGISCQEEKRAAGELAEFMRGLAFSAARQELKLNQSFIAHIICATAREVSADLIVVGTRGRNGVTKLMLGSVAERGPAYLPL